MNRLNENYGLIDEIAAGLNVVATIFIHDGNDYRRITTNIIDANGKRATGTFLGTENAAFAAVNSGKTYIGKVMIIGKEYIAGYEPIFEANSKTIIGILFVGIEISSVQEIVDARSRQTIVTIALIALLMLLVSIILTIIIFKRTIIKPLNEMVSALKDISEGDFTRHIEIISGDEIGDMAYYFDNSIEKIKKLILVIKKQALTLFATGNELASKMAESAAAVNQIVATIQSIKNRIINQSASVTETNATMEQITVSINKLNEQVEEQSASVNQSSSAIEEMLANISSVTRTLLGNAKNVQVLTEASKNGRSGLQGVSSDIQEIAHESEGLLEINAVMENIASQTNLLAMNAAIEAAHAGEAGKGFAVVSGEIRKLAESSTEQSKTISAVLKKIKTSIDKITKSTGTVLMKFEAIDSAIKTVSDQEKNISSAMEEQSSGSRHILEAIKHLNEITQSVRNGSTEMLNGSREVIKESKSLALVTSEISNGISGLAASSNQINSSIEHVNMISGQNKADIDTLVKEAARFKVE
jgi:methyl-accepting chemotaxis protein